MHAFLNPPTGRDALVMGVLNITPDSFSDGGRFVAPKRAIDHAAEMVREGADLIDVGGESTRPGAATVSQSEELERVIPVIEQLKSRFDVPVSVDTSKPSVMQAAVAAGASLINDVRALQEPGALEMAADLGVMVCLMHMQGQPRDMQQAPDYIDVVSEVSAFLSGRIEACEAAGMNRSKLLIDPGFGFGKSADHNLTLLAGLGEFRSLDCPLLVGLSRKSLLQTLTGRTVEERLAGSLALALRAVQNGAYILRVHDVGPTADALRVWHAVSHHESSSIPGAKNTITGKV